MKVLRSDVEEEPPFHAFQHTRVNALGGSGGSGWHGSFDVWTLGLIQGSFSRPPNREKFDCPLKRY